MIKKRRKYLNTGSHGSALLTDLSKGCDCNYHQLLIAKLNAYVVDMNSLDLLTSYWKKGNKEQKKMVLTVIWMTFLVAFLKVPYQVHYYLTYTSLIYFFGIGDLDITSNADDNTPYTFSSELDVALKKLRNYTIKVFE